MQDLHNIFPMVQIGLLWGRLKAYYCKHTIFRKSVQNLVWGLLSGKTSVMNHFYRATCMHSMDYAVARCPSVRHMPVLGLNDYTYIQSIFTVG